MALARMDVGARAALGIALLRIAFGAIFLTEGLAKLTGRSHVLPLVKGFNINLDGARGILASDTGGHPVGIYKTVIDDVVLGNWDVFKYLLTASELAFGVCLLLGAFTPIAALAAAGFALNLQFANIHRGDKWLWEYTIEWAPLLALGLMQPGRVFGLDAVLSRRWPRWPLT